MCSRLKRCRRQLHRPKKLTLARFLGLDRGPFLCSRSVDLRNISYLFHGLHGLRAGHQRSRSTAFDGAPCSYSQRNGRHTLIVRDIRDENEIKVAEAIPCSYHFAADSLARLATDRFDTILRFFPPEPPKIETYRPPGTCRTACCTSLAFLAAFRNERYRKKITHSKVDAARCYQTGDRQCLIARIVPDW